MRLEIVVREGHIASGKPRDEARCPVALAGREAFMSDELWVRCDSIVIGPNDVGIRPGSYPMSADLYRFVADVDHEQLVRPATFVLEVAAAPEIAP